MFNKEKKMKDIDKFDVSLCRMKKDQNKLTAFKKDDVAMGCSDGCWDGCIGTCRRFQH